MPQVRLRIDLPGEAPQRASPACWFALDGRVLVTLANARTENIETFVQDALQTDITRSASILDEEALNLGNCGK